MDGGLLDDTSATDLLEGIPEVDESLKSQTQSRVEQGGDRGSLLQPIFIAMSPRAEMSGFCFFDFAHNVHYLGSIAEEQSVQLLL